jgi:hypothetical protein
LHRLSYFSASAPVTMSDAIASFRSCLSYNFSKLTSHDCLMLSLLSSSSFFLYLDSNRKISTQCSTRWDVSIQRTPPTQQFKQKIALSLWNFDIDNPPSPYRPLNLEVYFRYYWQQADYFMHDAVHHVLVRTHHDILKISEIFNQNLDRAEVQEKVCSQVFPGKGAGQDKSLNASINLAVRLLLMVKVGDIPNGFSGYHSLQWDQGTLRQFLADQFAPRAAPLQERVRLEKGFTARNIERIAGIRLKWTDNLADHLRLFDSEDDELVVNIFHHASFLIMQQRK